MSYFAPYAIDPATGVGALMFGPRLAFHSLDEAVRAIGDDDGVLVAEFDHPFDFPAFVRTVDADRNELDRPEFFEEPLQ